MKTLDWNSGKWARQGDVKIKMVSEVPSGSVTDARENGVAVLAHGEVTGHSHKVVQGDVEFFTVGVTNMFSPKYLRVLSETALVVHEEHTAVPLVRGTYEVTVQREYFPEEIRNVLD